MACVGTLRIHHFILSVYVVERARRYLEASLFSSVCGRLSVYVVGRERRYLQASLASSSCSLVCAEP